jgi:hypothetical protein
VSSPWIRNGSAKSETHQPRNTKIHLKGELSASICAICGRIFNTNKKRNPASGEAGLQSVFRFLSALEMTREGFSYFSS